MKASFMKLVTGENLPSRNKLVCIHTLIKRVKFSTEKLYKIQRGENWGLIRSQGLILAPGAQSRLMQLRIY